MAGRGGGFAGNDVMVREYTVHIVVKGFRLLEISVGLSSFAWPHAHE